MCFKITFNFQFGSVKLDFSTTIFLNFETLKYFAYVNMFRDICVEHKINNSVYLKKNECCLISHSSYSILCFLWRLKAWPKWKWQEDKFILYSISHTFLKENHTRKNNLYRWTCRFSGQPEFVSISVYLKLRKYVILCVKSSL